MINTFRDAEGPRSLGSSIIELPKVGESQGEPCQRPSFDERRQLRTNLAGALRTPRQQVERTPIVANGKVCLAGSIAGLKLQLLVTALGRDRQGALSDLDGLTVLACDVPQSRRNVREHSSQSGAIAELGCYNFGFAHDSQGVVVAPERNQRDAQIEPHIDSLSQGVGCHGQPLQRLKRLLQKVDRCSIRRSSDLSLRGETKILCALVPRLGADRVTREALSLFARLIQLASLQRLEGAPMQGSSLLVQKARVRDFVCQRVLEAVLELGKQARLVEEFRGLQMHETPPQIAFALLK